MTDFRLKNTELNVDEIVMVYIEKGNYSKIFYHKNYTDYIFA
jgi:hypothetical protein